MRKVRPDKVRKAIEKRKIQGVREEMLERIRAKRGYKCSGCAAFVKNKGDFCDSCANEPAEDHK